MFRKDDRRLYRAAALESLSWLEHGFGTRHSSPWPAPWKVVTLRQVHSDRSVAVVGPRDHANSGDALITTTPGLLLGVRTADCIPILLVDERQRIVAAVHAGWRGTLAGVAPKTVSRMVKDFDAIPASMYAAIGPGIGACCYQVGPEVANRFQPLFAERTDLDRQTMLDLPEANRRQLLRAGIPAERITTGAPCTFCSTDEFHSFRRDPADTGRMLSVIGIRS